MRQVMSIKACARSELHPVRDVYPYTHKISVPLDTHFVSAACSDRSADREFVSVMTSNSWAFTQEKFALKLTSLGSFKLISSIDTVNCTLCERAARLLKKLRSTSKSIIFSS